jgi:dTDP-4-amino-4,6-dideoxygalactose transaminase
MRAVNKILEFNFFITRPQVELFGRELKSFFSSVLTPCINSAISALHLSSMAIDLKKVDYLWNAAISFVVNVNHAVYCRVN